MATEEPVIVTEVAAPEIGASVTVVVENEPAVEPAAGKPSKSKKTTTKRKPRTPSLHPPYFEMIKEAILALKEKSGSSQYAIAKFVEEKNKNLPANFKKVLLVQLKRLVADGKLVKVKASFKLPAAKVPASVAPAKKKSVVKKPKASAKPKPAAKKAPAKKKPAAKAKPVTKAKAVAKPKAAAKPKPVVKAKAAAPKAVAKPAVKAKAKAPAKSAKVAKTSTRSTPRGKAAPAAKPVKVARASTRSTPKKASVAAKPAVAKKSVKPKAATPKKAVRKGRK
ncbi:hypothetical protein OSB04_003321 [Centaurea solstitialis]|uniref:H15 domain-containing protein n=1 Tax=Centaurea solstitialis TaxID=347529 RepID=A0AA38U6B4_9ASTR|nr:hypothetical protein OSB04_003321 [Centaurea solstitialis]